MYCCPENSPVIFIFSKIKMIVIYQFTVKKYLANQSLALNFAPVLCVSLIKKGRGKWPVDALAT
jgi:hypothetical protein